MQPLFQHTIGPLLEVFFLLCKMYLANNSAIYWPISTKFGHNHYCHRPCQTSRPQLVRGQTEVTGVKSSFLLIFYAKSFNSITLGSRIA